MNDAVRKLVNPHFWIPIVVSVGMMVLVSYIVPLLGYAMLSAPQTYRFLASTSDNKFVGANSCGINVDCVSCSAC